MFQQGTTCLKTLAGQSHARYTERQKMPEIQICNFCDLFGFNSRMNPVGRLELKILDKTYPAGFEFTADTTGGALEIAKHLDDLALVY